MESTPWYRNRKFMAPIITAVATIVIAVMNSRIPDFDLSPDQFAGFLTMLWTAGVGIVFADAGYDWLNVIVRIVTALSNVQQQPPAQG